MSAQLCQSKLVHKAITDPQKQDFATKFKAAIVDLLMAQLIPSQASEFGTISAITKLFQFMLSLVATTELIQLAVPAKQPQAVTITTAAATSLAIEFAKVASFAIA